MVPSPVVSLMIGGGQLMTLGMFLQLNRKLEKLLIVLSLQDNLKSSQAIPPCQCYHSFSGTKAYMATNTGTLKKKSLNTHCFLPLSLPEIPSS